MGKGPGDDVRYPVGVKAGSPLKCGGISPPPVHCPFKSEKDYPSCPALLFCFPPARSEAKPAAPAAPPAAPAPVAGRVYRFAFIPKALHIPVFNYAKIGAER